MKRYYGFILVLSLLFQGVSLAEDNTYRVGASDILSITVYDNQDLTGDFLVSADGGIVYPLLGQLQLAGKSIDQIREEFTYLLEKDYLYNPIVSVTVKSYKSKSVKILGDVGNPGVHYLDKKTRLFELLSKAEGVSLQINEIMKGQKLRIVRQADVDSTGQSENGEIQTLYIDIYDLLVEGNKDANIYLEDGDIIYLPKIQKIHVVGEVKKPGSFPYEDGATVLLGITSAGGASENASLKEVTIKRIKNGKEVVINVEMSDLLQPEDIIDVPPKLQQFHVVGEVKKPGSFAYGEGTSVLLAITKAGGITEKASVKNTIIKRIRDGKEEKIKVEMGDLVHAEDIVEVPMSFW